MSNAYPKTLCFDIGKSFTKAFLVEVDKESLKIETRVSLPTSVGDLQFTIDILKNQIKAPKEAPVLITGSLPEAQDLAKKMTAVYVPKDVGEEASKVWLDSTGFKDPIILDASDYSYSANIKVDEVGAFLTTTISEVEIENYLGNKSLKPQTIPINQTQLEIEEAFFRIAFSHNPSFINAKDFANLVVTGAFFSLAPKQSRLALILLDILYKNKASQVKLDKYLFMHTFGALLSKSKVYGNLKNDFLVDLGAFVSFGGPNKAVLDYGFRENQEISVLEDEIALIPAANNQEIKITFHDKEKTKIKVRGGQFGVLLDGRIKPLRLAYNLDQSRENLRRWQQAIDKLEMI